MPSTLCDSFAARAKKKEAAERRHCRLATKLAGSPIPQARLGNKHDTKTPRNPDLFIATHLRFVPSASPQSQKKLQRKTHRNFGGGIKKNSFITFLHFPAAGGIRSTTIQEHKGSRRRRDVILQHNNSGASSRLGAHNNVAYMV